MEPTVRYERSRGHTPELDGALADYYQRLDAGERVDRAAFLAEYPALAEELAKALRDEMSVAKALHPSQTVDLHSTPRPGESHGLQIRCPHCSNQVELLADTPFEDITCRSCGSTFNLVHREEATRAAQPIKTIGRFELISRLGMGGFGSVWKARDTELDRIVAVKIPRKGQLAADELEQFFREARTAAQLRHPNIVTVHEVGRDQDTIFIVCDLVRGVELADWISSERPSARETVQLLRKVALALHHAHQAGIVHRDLKPSNIMIDTDGEPHLMDFGLAKRDTNEITMTVDGQVLGTPAYMSPEQAAGKSHWTDRRTDVYSLGVVLFRMLTGELPFRGNAQMQVFRRLREDPPSPRTLNRFVPRDLETITLKCLERDPNRRYATAHAVADELDRYLAGIPIAARPVARWERLARWARRKPAWAAAGSLVFILAVAGPLAAWRIDSQRRRLVDLMAEKDHLIERSAADRGRDAAEVQLLSQQLRIWEGKENAWKLWPPASERPPRGQLLRELERARFEELAAQLAAAQTAADQVDRWSLACGHLALALLAEHAARPEQALEQHRAAESLLRALTAQHPDEPAYSVGLARCTLAQARLSANDPARSHLALEESSRLLANLAAEARQGMPFRIDRFEVEMRSAAEAGFAGAQRHLDAATQLNRELSAAWPTDPIELYQLVCLLAREDPPPTPLSSARQSE